MEEWEKALVHTTKVSIYLHTTYITKFAISYLVFCSQFDIFLTTFVCMEILFKLSLQGGYLQPNSLQGSDNQLPLRTVGHLFQVLKLEPKNTKAIFRSGVVKLNLNRLEEAEEDLKKAEELDPDGMDESTYLALSAN